MRTSGFVVACGMREIGRRTVDGRVQVDFASGYRAATDDQGTDALTGILGAAAKRGYDALLADQMA